MKSREDKCRLAVFIHDLGDVYLFSSLAEKLPQFFSSFPLYQQEYLWLNLSLSGLLARRFPCLFIACGWRQNRAFALSKGEKLTVLLLSVPFPLDFVCTLLIHRPTFAHHSVLILEGPSSCSDLPQALLPRNIFLSGFNVFLEVSGLRCKQLLLELAVAREGMLRRTGCFVFDLQILIITHHFDEIVIPF